LIDDTNETKRGMLWLGAATAATRIIDIGSSLVILALLTREQMGTAALVLSTGAVVEALSGMGIAHSLIRAKDLTHDHEQSLFWLTSGMGLVLALVLVGMGPLLAREYSAPVLVPMLALAGLKLLLVGAALVPQQLLSKHLKFREVGAVQTIATLGEGLAKIGFAAAGVGAWAPVLGNVCRGAVLFAAVLAFSTFRPRLHFAWDEAKPHLRFGSRIAATSLLYHSYRNADYFLVGRFLGLEVLGIYRVAFDLAMQPMEIVMNLINRVTYPIYVKLAHDGEALKNALLRNTRSMTLLATPAVVFLFVATEDVLALVTHGRWLAAVPAVQVLVWGALVRGGAHLFPQVYIAVGRPNYAVVDAAVSLVLLVSSFWASLAYLPQFGVMAVCWAWIAMYPALLCMHLVFTRRLVPLRMLEYVRAFAPSLGGVLVMLAAMGVAVLSGVRTQGHLFALVVFSLVGLGAYTAYLRLALKIRLRDLVPKRQPAPA
jgi:O-antigen/teichoic acid export membrane protein